MIDLSKNPHDRLVVDLRRLEDRMGDPSLAKTALLVSDAWRALCVHPTG